MKNTFYGLLAALALVACSCNTPPVPPPAPPPGPQPYQPPSPPPVMGDAAPAPKPIGDAYDDACAAMAFAGCSDGKRANCAATMRHADVTGLTVVPVACLSSAKTVAADRACGFATCK